MPTNLCKPDNDRLMQSAMQLDGLVAWPPGPRTFTSTRCITVDMALTQALTPTNPALTPPDSDDGQPDYQQRLMTSLGIPNAVLVSNTCAVCLPSHTLATVLEINHIPAPVARNGLTGHTIHVWHNIEPSSADPGGPVQRMHLVGWDIISQDPFTYPKLPGGHDGPTMGVRLVLGPAAADNPGLPYDLGGLHRPQPGDVYATVVTTAHDHQVQARPTG